MRLIKVSAPKGLGNEVIQTAFLVGIKEVSMQEVEFHHTGGEIKQKDVVDIQTSTPKAKAFTDALINADFYNQTDFSINTRQPRSIIGGENLSEITYPRTEPTIDIFEELWQFSHITISFAGRVFIAGCLLAFGLINQQILMIIAGLLFLPLLPLLLSVGFGTWTRQWKLAKQGGAAFLTAVGLLVLAGLLVATFCSPPLKYDEFHSLPVGFLISLAVGIAAVLANIDDVGKRELIGLAATAQIAILPVWIGICLIFGVPSTVSQNEFTIRIVSFFVNMLTIIIASLITYILIGGVNRSVKKIKHN